MEKQNPQKNKSVDLQKKAEDLINAKLVKLNLQLSEADMQKLIQELFVHHVELKMQNEELILAEKKSELSLIYNNALLEAIPDLMFVLDSNCRFVDYHANNIENLYTKSNFFIGKLVEEVLPPNIAVMFRESITNVFATGKLTNNTYELTINKKIHYFESRIVPCGSNLVLSVVRDITERKQAEKQLKESEEKYRLIAENTSDGIIIFNAENKIEYASPAYIHQLGYSEIEEFDRTPEDIYSIIHPDDRGALFSRIYKAIELKQSELTYTYRVKFKDGYYVWREDHAKFKYDSFGNYNGSYVICRDISERKQTEELLMVNESLLRESQKVAHIGSYATDLITREWKASDEIYEIFGIDKTYPLTFDNWVKLIHQDSREKLIEYHLQVETEKKRFDYEYKIIRINDGKERWVHGLGELEYDADLNPIRMIGTIQDITDQKNTENILRESEQKYRLLSENITDGIFICKNGNIEYANKAMNNIFGYNDLELESKNLSLLAKPEYRHILNDFLLLASSCDKIQKIEIECLKKNGSTVFLEMLLNYIANSKVIYGVAHDITEKKQIQKKNIIKAIIQTEEKERSYFSKELHDGLGPLLSTIKLYLQWSQRPKSNKSRAEIILKAENILEEALITVKEISNKLSPHLLTHYGLTSAIQNFVDKFKETSTIKIDFQSNVTGRLDIEIEAALYRAVIECINNTIKHAEASNISIILNELDNQINLKYSDDGKGFDLTETLLLQKGLGLFNLQNRIQTIGGEITMFSEPEHGVDYEISVNI